VTLKELAMRLGVQAASLRNQVRRGALAAVKEGRDWFVTVEEAKRYEEEQAGKMGAASPRHSRIGNRHPRKKHEPSSDT
jgi:predicted site-specific integrase-resolvase